MGNTLVRGARSKVLSSLNHGLLEYYFAPFSRQRSDKRLSVNIRSGLALMDTPLETQLAVSVVLTLGSVFVQPSGGIRVVSSSLSVSDLHFANDRGYFAAFEKGTK